MTATQAYPQPSTTNMRAPTLLLLLSASASAQPPAFSDLAALFEYQRPAEVGLAASEKERRENAVIFDSSFDSPVEGRVPGFLVKPNQGGPRPVILYGHWMMTDAPDRNKTEFLEEAVAMAQSGVLCLLLDTPLVRPGAPGDGSEVDPMDGVGPKAQLQMAKEWRLALDLLLEREDVDPSRIAYVGHSFSAGVGAMLSGVEKRIGSFVLMANQYSLREFVFDEQNPALMAERKKLGDGWFDAYFAKFPWADTVHFVEQSSPAAVFLQFGREDKGISLPIAELGFSHFGEPKQMKLYDAGHKLDDEARQDRIEWLLQRLCAPSVKVGCAP